MRGVGFRACKRWAVLLAAVCTVALAVPARAADSNEDELIRQGVAKRRHQDDEAALALFTQAYAIRKSPRAAGQMGLAEQALGRWLEAEGHLQEALTASSDPWIAKNTDSLKAALATVQRHLGSLQVLGGPTGAEVVLEGEVRGRLPMDQPIRVRTGDCRFDVRAPGYEPLTRTVQISPEALTRETVRLSLAPVAASSEPAAAAPPAVTPQPQQPAPEGDTSGDGRTLRVVGLSLAAGGVAFIGGGVAFGLLARSQGQTDSAAMTFNPDNQSKGQTYQTLQYVGYGVGGALLAAGVITYVVGYQRGEAQPATQTAFLPSIVPVAGGFMAGFAGSL
jgi:PEGA domain